MPRETEKSSGTMAESALISLFFLIYPVPSAALPDHAKVCETAADFAAKKVGVPVAIMQAITKVETGQTIRGQFNPWAWTVNVEGHGLWFNSKKEAIVYATEQHRRGARSFDVGCFQLNYKWHGHNFSSISKMFDPYENALYAARFLKQLFSEFGEWSAATGAYHSRTQKHANTYLAKVERILEDTEYSNFATAQSTNANVSYPQNGFPFLQAAEHTSRLGSLVPQVSGNRASLFVSPIRGN